MSASPVARQAVSHAQDKVQQQNDSTNAGETKPQLIPRRVVINSPADMPSEFGTTPGGTIFSTTPGGSRIIYERAFLLSLKSSPLAQSPPKNLPVIPGVTKLDPNVQSTKVNDTIIEEPEKTGEDDHQFAMDL